MPHPLPDWIIQADLQAWHYLNGVWRSDSLDTLIPFLRNQFFWAPVYLFLLVFTVYNFGARGVLWSLAFILCFAITDPVSSAVIKPFVQRIRPCNDRELSGLAHVIVPCGSGYSFPSSHAANHFALGSFAAITFHRSVKWLWPVPLVWALAVAYAQVYVGVHFPADTIGGAFLGLLVGCVVGVVFNRWKPLHESPNRVRELRRSRSGLPAEAHPSSSET